MLYRPLYSNFATAIYSDPRLDSFVTKVNHNDWLQAQNSGILNCHIGMLGQESWRQPVARLYECRNDDCVQPVISIFFKYQNTAIFQVFPADITTHYSSLFRKNSWNISQV